MSPVTISPEEKEVLLTALERWILSCCGWSTASSKERANHVAGGRCPLRDKCWAPGRPPCVGMLLRLKDEMVQEIEVKKVRAVYE